MIAALTQIDRLRPLQEWNPPYRLDPAEGMKAEQIANAVEAVAADLDLPPGDVIPVCLLPERMYNVEEALVPAMLDRLPAAQRVKYVHVCGSITTSSTGGICGNRQSPQGGCCGIGFERDRGE